MDRADDSGVSQCGYATGGSSPSTGSSRPPSLGVASRPSSGNGSLPSPLRPELSFEEMRQSQILASMPIHGCMFPPAEQQTVREYILSQMRHMSPGPHESPSASTMVTNGAPAQHHKQQQQQQARQQQLESSKKPSSLVQFVFSENGNMIFRCPIEDCTNLVFYEKEKFARHLVSLHCSATTVEDCETIFERIISAVSTIITRKRVKRVKVKKSTEQPAINKLMRIDTHVPRFSKGMMTTFGCKHCKERFVCKASRWVHEGTLHFDPQKMKSCPDCLFVTTLKHHLEFHEKKHMGIKPFECLVKGCTYRCENEAMLVSHQKSHSDINFFHCGTCAYKCKYLTTYKAHCESKNHQVGVVYNFDGTVNNDIVILLNTPKRGPRPKKQIRKTIENNNNIKSPIDYESVELPAISADIQMQQEDVQSPSAYNLTFQEDVKMPHVLSFFAPRTSQSDNECTPLDLSNAGISEEAIDLRQPSTSGTTNKRKGIPVKRCRTLVSEESDDDENFVKKQSTESFCCPYYDNGCITVYCNVDILRKHVECHVRSNPLICSKCGTIASSFEQFSEHLMLKGLDH